MMTYVNKTTLLVWRDITRNEHCLVHWLDILIERSAGAICCVIISTTRRKATQACFLCNAKVFSLKWHLRVTHSLSRSSSGTRKPSSACPFCGRAYRLLSEFLLHLYKRHPKKTVSHSLHAEYWAASTHKTTAHISFRQGTFPVTKNRKPSLSLL